MRHISFVVVAGFVIATSIADTFATTTRQGNHCRTLSEIESSAIVGASFLDEHECKKVGYCWYFTPTNCASITLDPGENEGTVAMQCTQSFQDEQVISGKNESCQKSNDENSKCTQSTATVVCRRVYNCVWDSITKVCYVGSNTSSSTAPADCKNE